MAAQGQAPATDGRTSREAPEKRPEAPGMVYRELGTTGERVSAIGLGGYHDLPFARAGVQAGAVQGGDSAAGVGESPTPTKSMHHHGRRHRHHHHHKKSM